MKKKFVRVIVMEEYPSAPNSSTRKPLLKRINIRFRLILRGVPAGARWLRFVPARRCDVSAFPQGWGIGTQTSQARYFPIPSDRRPAPSSQPHHFPGHGPSDSNPASLARQVPLLSKHRGLASPRLAGFLEAEPTLAHGFKLSTGLVRPARCSGEFSVVQVATASARCRR